MSVVSGYLQAIGDPLPSIAPGTALVIVLTDDRRYSHGAVSRWLVETDQLAFGRFMAEVLDAAGVRHNLPR